MAASDSENDAVLQPPADQSFSAACNTSRLYYPYRALGLITDAVPYVLNRLGDACFITASTGRSFQIFDATHLRVVAASPPMPGRVRRLACRGDKFTYVACGSSITSWRRLSCQGVLGEHPGEVTQLLVIGDVLVSACDAGRLRAWRLVRPRRPVVSKFSAVKKFSAGVGDTAAEDEKKEEEEEEGSERESEAGDSSNDNDSSDDAAEEKDYGGSSDDTREISEPEARRGSTPLKKGLGRAGALMTDMALPPGFVPTVLAKPPTYVNKVVIGSESGALSLWNIVTGKHIHAFRCLDLATTHSSTAESNGRSSSVAAKTAASDTGGGKAAITALEPSPALDVAAVGLSNGLVLLVNLRLDTVLFQFRQNGPVTALAFRTDVGAERLPMLASGASSGAVHIWDLKTRRLHHTMRCHAARVAALSFLPGEAVLLSSGADNALKMWVFDAADGTARTLRAREGHSAPPRRVRYVGGGISAAAAAGGEGAEALAVLSAGDDRSFRLFHTVRDCLSVELSQKALLKVGRKHEVMRDGSRLRPVLAFASCDARARDWDDVVTCHERDSNCYVWSSRRRAAGKFVLRQPHWQGNAMMHAQDPQTFATSVCISACGSFALVGTRGGAVFKYSMQSGQPRGSFPREATPTSASRKRPRPGSVAAAIAAVHPTAKPVKSAAGAAAAAKEAANGGVAAAAAAGGGNGRAFQGHSAAVTGVQSDAVNGTVVTAGLDGRLIFWGFASHDQESELQVGAAVSQTEMMRDSGLLAAACDDLAIRVYDTTARRLVRKLRGHTGALVDLCFAADGRRLASAAADRSLRVWDLPTGRCVDWLAFRSAPTAVAASPTGEFLVTAHADRVGLSVWADRSFFQPVFLDAEPVAPALMDEPAPMPEAPSATAVAEAEEAAAAMAAAASIRSSASREEPEEFRRAIRGARVTAITAATAAAADDVAEDAADAAADGRQNGGGASGVNGQRGGMITLSTLPRAYWATLFNLEVVKARNKPILPPQKPQSAPFFLPTAHRGVEPEFAANFGTPAEGPTAAAAAESAAKKATARKEQDEQEAALLELGSWNGGNWSGEDEEDKEEENEADGDSGGGGGSSGSAPANAAAVSRKRPASAALGREDASRQLQPPAGKKSSAPAESASRILHSLGNGGGGRRGKKSAAPPALPPRCRLAELLAAAGGGSGGSGKDVDVAGSGGSSGGGKYEAAMAYLTTLGPPAVDSEMTQLCRGPGDAVGERLLGTMADLLLEGVRGHGRFEVVQAYLHRYLRLHDQAIAASPRLRRRAAALAAAQAEAASRLRGLVQHNLCLVQFFSDMQA